ncbi:MAG TPA: hypothetical protein VFQ45_10025 [Longimicrobium sp.]|nr:hypothetical protein [Longimicrobium sp.]
MRKLKLDVEALQVEEFATEEVEAGQRGTVRGLGSIYSNCAPECESRSEDPGCFCEIETRVEQFTCYAGCM